MGRLREQGTPLHLVFVPLDHRALWLEPSPGEVTVRTDFDERTPIARAVAYVWRSGDGIERAEIVIQDCALDVVLHELAIATGQIARVWGRDPSERPLGGSR